MIEFHELRDLPVFEGVDDGTLARVAALAADVRLDAGQWMVREGDPAVMAALDDTHFPWVHPGILGDPSQPEPPDHKAWVEGDHLVAAYTIQQPANISLGSAEGATGLEPVTYTNNCFPCLPGGSGC